MSIRGPFPTSRSGSKNGTRSSSKAGGGSTPTKSYDPVEWAEKKRIAIARAEKLKVERRKAKEAAARIEGQGDEGEHLREESEDELLQMHDNIDYNPASYVDGKKGEEMVKGGTLRGESEFLRTQGVEAYLRGKEVVPTTQPEGSYDGAAAVQWKWIGPDGDGGGENRNEDKPSVPPPIDPSESQAEVLARQHQPVDTLPASLAQKLDRRRDRLKERQQKAHASRILENRNAVPKEASRPLQTRASKSVLGNSGERSRGVGGGRKVEGKIRAPAPPTRKPPPPPPPPSLPKRDGISSASTVATSKGNRRDEEKGKKRKVKGVVQKEEDPSTRQMYDKNTLRIIGREDFIKAIGLWRDENIKRCKNGADAGGGSDVRGCCSTEGRGGVHVCVRKRPLFEKEESIKLEYDVVSCVDENTITLHNCLYQADLKRPLISHLSSKFARVFNESADNEFVYKNSGSQEMVLNACRGGLSTMFMFGQTGSGKTHTMTSIESRAAKDIFQNIPAGATVTVSFNEICGKHVFDLMAPKRTEVRLRDAGNNTVLLEGAVSVSVEDSEALIDIIRQSHTRRKTETTGANDVSSRSHAVCRISIALPGTKTIGSLVLVDCAGTERRKDSFYHDKVRQQEGAEINASLHALKECIRYRMLRQQPSEKESGPSSSFVPFRGSALTRVLAEGFVREDALLHVMATVSPCATDIDHSISTLKAVSMLSSVDDTLKEVRQTELFPIVKKELPKHPKHWDAEELTNWIATVCNGAFKNIKLASGTSGAMVVRWPAKRFAQLCGGDCPRGQRLYNTLHNLMDHITKLRENERKESRCFHSNQQAIRERLLKQHGRTGIVGAGRDHIQS